MKENPEALFNRIKDACQRDAIHFAVKCGQVKEMGYAAPDEESKAILDLQAISSVTARCEGVEKWKRLKEVIQAAVPEFDAFLLAIATAKRIHDPDEPFVENHNIVFLLRSRIMMAGAPDTALLTRMAKEVGTDATSFIRRVHTMEEQMKATQGGSFIELADRQIPGAARSSA